MMGVEHRGKETPLVEPHHTRTLPLKPRTCRAGTGPQAILPSTSCSHNNPLPLSAQHFGATANFTHSTPDSSRLNSGPGLRHQRLMAFATDLSSTDAFQAEVLSTPGVLQGAFWDRQHSTPFPAFLTTLLRTQSWSATASGQGPASPLSAHSSPCTSA